VSVWRVGRNQLTERIRAMSVITDFKSRTIIITQPVLERKRMSKSCYHYAPENPATARFRLHQGDLRPKVQYTQNFLLLLRGRKKIKIGNEFFKVVIKERGQGCVADTFAKAKPSKMSGVKAHYKNSKYQGATQVQYSKIIRPGKCKY